MVPIDVKIVMERVNGLNNVLKFFFFNISNSISIVTRVRSMA